MDFLDLVNRALGLKWPWPFSDPWRRPWPWRGSRWLQSEPLCQRRPPYVQRRCIVQPRTLQQSGLPVSYQCFTSVIPGLAVGTTPVYRSTSYRSTVWFTSVVPVSYQCLTSVLPNLAVDTTPPYRSVSYRSTVWSTSVLPVSYQCFTSVLPNLAVGTTPVYRSTSYRSTVWFTSVLRVFCRCSTTSGGGKSVVICDRHGASVSFNGKSFNCLQVVWLDQWVGDVAVWPRVKVNCSHLQRTTTSTRVCTYIHTYINEFVERISKCL